MQILNAQKTMESYKKEFIELLVKADALKFGTFTLKSGRIAPYILNVGCFHTGELLHQLARFYAQALLNTGADIDILFGSAYKGIPLATATVTILHAEFGKNISYSFNRKKLKDYALKDNIVGAPLSPEKRVMLIDDTVTAGTAIRECVAIMKEYGDPKIVGIVIGLDRMEKNNDGKPAIKALEEELGAPVFSIVNLDEVIEVLYNKEVHGRVFIDEERMKSINTYRAEYGI